MTDSLSVPVIASRQQEVEQQVQGIPQMQQQMDEQALKAEIDFKRAEAKALLKVPGTVDGRRMTVSERDSRVFEECEREWEAWQSARIQADYARAVGKALFSELSSLQSRLRVAFESDKAHGRYGQG